MGARTTDFWLEAETALGFRTFYSSHLATVRRIVAIRGSSSLVLDSIAQTYTDQGRRAIRWHSVHHPDTLTGVVIPHRQTAWVAGELFATVSPPLGPILEWFSVGPKMASEPRLTEPKARLKKCLKGALTALEEAEADHEDGDRQLINSWVGQYLPPRNQRPGRGQHYFGCPLTSSGPQPAFLERRFSTLEITIHLSNKPLWTIAQSIRRFTEEALLRGYPAEIYHNTLEPSWIDHVVIPDIGLGITSARAPHQVSGGKVRAWPYLVPAPALRNDETEYWWEVYQKLYVQAWKIMESMREIQHQSQPQAPSELPRIVADCIA